MTATSPPLRGLTWQEFLDLPEHPTLRHAELINGEVGFAIRLGDLVER